MNDDKHAAAPGNPAGDGHGGSGVGEVPADYTTVVQELQSLLKLKTTIVGIKLFEQASALDRIPKLRRPTSVHTTDQIVAMAARLNWTVGITADDLVGDQCRAVIGLAPQSDEWLAGKRYVGVWHATAEDAGRRQQALSVVPYGRYRAMAVSPLSSGRLAAPDICLVYANPAQMILLINGLQWRDYRSFNWSVVGETACADSWGRALKTGEPSLSLPCFAERRYGGVPDDELLFAAPPRSLQPIVDGLRALSGNGIRYPVPAYGIQSDVRAGMAVSYVAPTSRAQKGERT